MVSTNHTYLLNKFFAIRFSVIRYKYTKFDEQGNWTEREMYYDIMQTTEAYEGNENPAKEYSKEYYIQERTITYY